MQSSALFIADAVINYVKTWEKFLFILCPDWQQALRFSKGSNCREDTFERCLLEWEIPLKMNRLPITPSGFRKRLLHENPVLVGVSFGGILVQEMAKVIPVRKVIIISSAKCNTEFPRTGIKIAKNTGAYKLLPLKLLLKVENLAKYSFGPKINERLKLYEKYLSVRDVKYWHWAIEQVMLWEALRAG